MAEPIERVTALPKLPGRRADAHKGDFGRVLVVGGSRGMIGAPALAANAALRGGAGLVTVAVPETVQLAAAALCPCATSIALACAADGALGGAAVRQAMDAAKACDVLAVGPGMARGTVQRDIVRAAVEQTTPVVLDADALNNLAEIDNWAALVRCPLVLTPHPGEFATLTGGSVASIQSGREGSALAAARQWAGEAGGTGCSQPVSAHETPGAEDPTRAVSSPCHPELVVILKGAGTVVTDGRRVYVNRTGNPGMATGGAGDVLTGLIAALIGQGLAIFDAACLGVHLHGLAGDLAAEKLGQLSLTASDLIDFLPEAALAFQAA